MEEAEVFQIILHAGNGRAEAYGALSAAEAGDFIAATRRLEAAETEIAAAHAVQTAALQREARGVQERASLLDVHAQDHLMTAMAEKTLIEGMIRLLRRVTELEKALAKGGGHDGL